MLPIADAHKGHGHESHGHGHSHDADGLDPTPGSIH